MQPAIDQHRLVDELEAKLAAQRAELRDLATMGAVITSIRELDAILSVVMDMSLRLVNGEVGGLLMDKGGQLQVAVSWGVSESFLRSLVYADEQDVATYAFTRREPLVLNDLGIVTESKIHLDSVLAVPIQTKETCFGVLVIMNRTDGLQFSNDDIEQLDMLLRFVAVAIDNVRMMGEELKRQAMEQEMKIARDVQSTILPANVDELEGLQIGIAYHPAKDVGGDFYDVISVGSGSCIMMIGDVSNKGVPAALVMSACSGIIKTILDANPDIEIDQLACKVNDLMAGEIIKDKEMYVTLFFCRVDLVQGSLTYTNAGHLPGLLWDADRKQLDELAIGGPIIGQFPEAVFRKGSHSFGPNDQLFLFTDGLTEATDRTQQLFGRARVEEAFRATQSLSPDRFCLAIKQRVDEFTAGAPAEWQDDFTILQVRRHG